MENPSRLSLSVMAAALAAILGGLFLLLGCSVVFFALLLNPFPAHAPGIPPFIKTVTLATLSFMMCLSIFGVATGLGLLLLRKWARLSVLVWGGFSAFFGAFGIPVAFLMPLTPPASASQLPAESMQAVRWILLVVYGLPLVVGLWWLILFNRKSVKGQFLGTTAPAGASLPPGCPLPITVLAWFYIASVANFILIPFLPFRVPVLVFGRVLPGNAGRTVLILCCLALAACGVGLLKLKPWSYSLAIGLQVFGLTSTVVTVLSPNYDAMMDSFAKQMQDSLHLPPTQFSTGNFMHHQGWALSLVLLFAGVILSLLLYYRPRFLEAADRALSS
jgi:hypothetical protein